MSNYAPFTKNQQRYIYKSFDSWLNVAEGGKRAGKNIINTLAFCINLEEHPAYLHLVAGVTQGTAGINVIECDGFGIREFFKGRCRDGKYEGRNCLYIQTKTGEKAVLVAGGRSKGDEAYIKGFTIGSAYITEVNECTIEFLNEVLDRTLASQRRKIFLDLNPKSPKHKFYEWLSFHEQQQKKNSNYGYNYGHFTIADNLSMSNEKLKEVLNTYDKKSAYYKRDIRGERCSTEGIIYPLFANNPTRYEIDQKEIWTKDNPTGKYKIQFVRVGVDFGGSGSSHSFTATGFTSNYKELIVLKSKLVDAKGTSPIDLENSYCKFVRDIYNTYGIGFKSRCDSAEQVLINGIRVANYKLDLPIYVCNALKKSIIDRIRCTNSLLAQDRFKIVKGECDELEQALSNAVWKPDETEDIRLDNGTFSVDSLDSYEYSYEEDIKKLDLTRLGKE